MSSDKASTELINTETVNLKEKAQGTDPLVKTTEVTGSSLIVIQSVEVEETLTLVVGVPVIANASPNERQQEALRIVKQGYNEGLVVLNEDSYSATRYAILDDIESDYIIPNYNFKELYKERIDGKLWVDDDGKLIVDYDGFGLMDDPNKHTNHSLKAISLGEGEEYYTKKPNPFKVQEQRAEPALFVTREFLTQAEPFKTVKTNRGEKKFSTPIPTDDFEVLGKNSEGKKLAKLKHDGMEYRVYLEDFNYTTIRVYANE